MYEGRTEFEQGRVFGHENLGQVVEVGDAVEKLQVGDSVSLPCSVACGQCVTCERGLTNCWVVDRHPDRLRLAQEIGAVASFRGAGATRARAAWLGGGT